MVGSTAKKNMKIVPIVLISLLLLMLNVGAVFAAGTCVEANNGPTYAYTNDDPTYKKSARVVTLLCTHHTDNSLSVTLSSDVMADLAGRYVYYIKSYPGSTAPTDATDLSIVDSDGLSLLGIADNGADFIDATSTLAATPYNVHMSTNMYWMPVLNEAWTISTANNAVASATFYLKIYLVP